jgi:hypothetical protein
MRGEPLEILLVAEERILVVVDEEHLLTIFPPLPGAEGYRATACGSLWGATVASETWSLLTRTGGGA